jgi:protein-S-isoprenylcysteine O-methyltransferase Ste14
LYTVGYLVESPRLGNQIRSVDPTFLGWAAALMCYAPFSALTYFVLDAPREEFPQFADPTVHVVMNVLVLILLAIYTSASLALGLKASNLTHRGIVARGPYAIVRHPAYVCKNAAWWIGSIPIVAATWERSIATSLLIIGSIVGWAALYVLRAITEEDHLRSVDGDYDAYAAKVRYRFIPGVI